MFRKQDKKNQNGEEKEITNDALLTKDEEIELAKIIANEKTKLLNALVDIECFGDAIADLILLVGAMQEYADDIANNQNLLLTLSEIKEINALYKKDPKSECKEKLVNLLDVIYTPYIGNILKACKERAYQFGDSVIVIDRIKSVIDDARQKMIMANQKLVVSIAKNYISSGLPLSDIIQEGNIGLMKAVDKFDHEKGVRFANYAATWIKRSIYSAIADQAYIVSVPVHTAEAIGKIAKASRLLTQQNGREPSIEELAENLNMPIDKIANILQIIKKPISLETPINDKDNARLADILEDKNTISPLDNVIALDLSDKIDMVLSTLSKREQLVIRMRFGLTNNDTHTLEEVGNLFSITHQRIKQIELRSVKKMASKSAVLH